jgi:hypothetical protein
MKEFIVRGEDICQFACSACRTEHQYLFVIALQNQTKKNLRDNGLIVELISKADSWYFMLQPNII